MIKKTHWHKLDTTSKDVTFESLYMEGNAGNFQLTLLKAYFKADRKNRDRLEIAFPSLKQARKNQENL